MKLYSFYDTIAEEYSLPFGAKNNACAVRIYEQNKRNTQTPENFEKEIKLFELGKFEQDDGTIKLDFKEVQLTEKDIYAGVDNETKES